MVRVSCALFCPRVCDFDFKGAIFTVLMFVCFTGRTNAQGPAPGLPVNSAQIPVPLGSINPLAQNVHLEIPIASVGQRGNHLMVAKMVGDTLYNLTPGHVPSYQGIGWRFVFTWTPSGSVTSTSTNGPCPHPAYPNGGAYTTSNYAIIDSNGTYHNIGSGLYVYHIVCRDVSGNPDPDTGSPSGFTGSDVDGLGYTLTVSNYTDVSLYDIDGTLLANDLIASKDTNGNYFSGVGPLTDMFGRTSISPRGNVWPTCSSISHTTNYVDVTASDGSTNTYTFNCQQYSISQTGYPTATVWLLSSIILPNGTSSYQFSYDSGTSGNHFAALKSVTLPTGDQVTFSYACTTSPVWPCDLTSAAFGGGTWNFSYVKQNNVPVTATVTGPPRYDSASQQYLNDKTIYAGSSAKINSIQYYSGASTLLKTVSYTYKIPLAALLDTITTTLNDTGQSSKVQYQYVANLRNRPSQIQEWDFGSSVPNRTTKYTYGIYNKLTSVSVWDGDGTTGSPASQTNYTYDEYGANYCKNGVPMLAGVTGATYHDDTNYGVNFTNRGNVTSISQLVSGTTWVTSHKCYDTLGNVTQDVDSAGHPTTYDYSENWADTSCVPAGTITHGYPTTITDAIGNRRRTKYYTCTGLAQALQDENDIAAGRAGTTYTYDFANRQTSINSTDGGQTTLVYDDSLYNPTNNKPNVTTTQKITATDNLITTTAMDGFGRTVRTLLTSDRDGTDIVDYTYDNLGRLATKSNPHRSSALLTDGVFTNSYDALGRITAIQEPDGSFITTTYLGNTVTVTDEVLKKRTIYFDALGRLRTIIEDPEGVYYPTNYEYDALDDLLCVEQMGYVGAGSGCLSDPSNDATSLFRVRRFNYDSLGRLVSSKNPESGTINYFYTRTDGSLCSGDGALCRKQAPKPSQTGSSTVTTYFTYDAADRVVMKSYDDGTTPIAKYGYDGVALSGCATPPPALADSNPKGARTAMCDGSGATSWKHDSIGRIIQEKRTILGNAAVTNTTSYAYNLDGSSASTTYPNTGKIVSYVAGGSGRPLALKDYGSAVNYVQNAHYAPFGGLTSMTYGATPITITNSYNNRAQPVLLSASSPSGTIMSVCYDFHSKVAINSTPCTLSADPVGNNGNVFKIVNNRDNNRTQNFTYDALNRIQQANSTGTNWGETFTIDPWGNLTNRNAIAGKTNPNYVQLNAAPASIQNRLPGYSYDAAGNMTVNGSANYSYDADNRIITTAGVTYTYDGDGYRVKKSNATLYWRGLGGETLSESDLSGSVQREYIYFSGMRVARRDVPTNSIKYYLSDYLGSASIITNSTGSLPVLEESDYYPYGGEMIITNNDTNQYKFTGKERDTESGLDNSVARYFGASLGRFLSIDPENAGADPFNPQSWNAYSYVLNNPLNSTDPDGEEPCSPSNDVCVVATPPPDIDTTSIDINTLIVARLNEETKSAQQSVLQQALDAARQWFAAPRDPTCMAKAMGAGVAIGAPTGGVLGALGGGTVGGLATAPSGPGIFLGIAGGGSLGAVKGAVGGGAIGGLAGGAMGFVACKTGGTGGGSTGGGSTGGGDNRPEGVPSNWKKALSRNGMEKWVDPNNPHNFVRMRTDGSITQVRNGMALDVNGNPVLQNSPEAHFPASQFVFRP